MNILKYIFSRNKDGDQNGLLQAELNGFLLESEHLLARLRQERLRSERSDLPLSLVVFDLAGIVELLVQANSIKTNGFLRHFADVLQHSTRESDVKGWYEEGKIALLMPDTNIAGAKILVSNFTRILLRYPNLDGAFGEEQMRQFIGISSLHRNKSYMAY